MTGKQAVSLDFDAFEATDTGRMEVLDVRGNPTGWFWEFAGPGHEKTIAQGNRIAREALTKAAQIEQAQVNGRKYKAEADEPDEVRARNVANVVERLIGWSEIEIGGKPFAFSPDAAREFLSHPKRIGVLAQAMEFLAAERSFTPRSSEN